MVRTQISLDHEQMKRLRELARDREVSIASLVREGVDRVLEDAARTDIKARALAAVGRFSWEGSGRDHDAELDDAFSE